MTDNNFANFKKLRIKTGLSKRELATELGYDIRTITRWDNGDCVPKKVILDRLKELIKSKSNIISFNGNKFTFIDLFAGIGGLRKGFETIGGKCIFTSEWDKYALQTYLANYNCNHEVVGDITKIAAGDIPKHDVLLAGFPCQPFSIAGVSKKNSLHRPHGFNCETQGTLFFDVARIIAYHKPKAFLLENVKNLVNHDKGRTFKIIHKTLTEELGYNISYKILDARYWVPQHRERIYIVGFKSQNNFSFDNFEVPNKIHLLEEILHTEDGSEKKESPYTQGLKSKVADKYTLSDQLWNYLQNYAQKHKEKGNGFGFGLVNKNNVSRTLSARYYKDGSEILIQRDSGNPRRLTPRECARLMGYDKNKENKFVIPVSDTQAYKQFGNSVVVPVVEAVAKHMAPFIYEAVDAKEHLSEYKINKQA